MKRILQYTLILVAIMFPMSIYAQSNVEYGRVIVEKNPGAIIEAFDLEKSTAIEGSFYMNPEWQVGSVYLYDGRRIEKMPLKYNMRDDFMHILDKNEEVRVLKFDRIASFEWFNVETRKNQKFVNSLDYSMNGTSLTGFLQVLSEGDPQLLKYTTLELSKGNYAVTHDAGQRYDEYIQKEKRYLAMEGNLSPANKKKEVLNAFGKKKEEIEEYIKANRLNMKSDDHIITLINFYNTL
jgi:hypothetical protein